MGSGEQSLVVRTREGVVSRQTGEPIACFVANGMSDQEFLFSSASFTSDHAIRIVTRDGAVTTVTFDPHTLHAANALDRCTDAPVYDD